MVDMDQIKKDIERRQREYEIRKRKEEEIWSKVSNHPPSEVPGNWRIYLANRSNGPCIYEYNGYTTNFWGTRQPNKLVDKLMFPNSQGRKYYKVGDKILSGEQDEDTLNRLFPELAKSGKKEADWTDLIWWYLNEGEKEKYKFGWIIRSITPNKKGGGRIGMTGIIHFEGYNVELDTIHYWNRRELNDNFVFSSYDFTIIQMLAKASVTVSLVALQGVSKAASASVKLVAKKAIKKELKKRASKRMRRMVYKAVKSHFIKTAASSTKEFFIVLAKELKKRNSEKEFYERISGGSASWKVMEPALRAAMFAFIAKLVDGLFTASIGEPLSKNSEMQKIERELVTIYLSFLMTTPFNSVIKAVDTAYTKSQRTNKPMWMFLEVELNNNLKDALKQAIMKDVTGAVTG